MEQVAYYVCLVLQGCLRWECGEGVEAQTSCGMRRGFSAAACRPKEKQYNLQYSGARLQLACGSQWSPPPTPSSAALNHETGGTNRETGHGLD